jgi:hypothetical protein
LCLRLFGWRCGTKTIFGFDHRCHCSKICLVREIGLRMVAAEFMVGSVIAFSNRVSIVNYFFVAAPGHGSLRGRNNPPQHLVRRKHKRCYVHNELTCTAAAQGAPSQQPVPSPGGEPSHPLSRSMNLNEQWRQTALASSDQRNACPDRQVLWRPTESLLATATPSDLWCVSMNHPNN